MVDGVVYDGTGWLMGWLKFWGLGVVVFLGLGVEGWEVKVDGDRGAKWLQNLNNARKRELDIFDATADEADQPNPPQP